MIHTIMQSIHQTLWALFSFLNKKNYFSFFSHLETLTHDGTQPRRYLFLHSNIEGAEIIFISIFGAPKYMIKLCNIPKDSPKTVYVGHRLVKSFDGGCCSGISRPLSCKESFQLMYSGYTG